MWRYSILGFGVMSERLCGVEVVLCIGVWVSRQPFTLGAGMCEGV